MDPKDPYRRRRLRWAAKSTHKQRRKWPWLPWAIGAGSILTAFLTILIIRGVSGSFPEMPASFQELKLGAWDIAHGLISVLFVPISFILQFILNWIRAPEKMDKQLQVEFDTAIQKARVDATNLDLQRQTEIESLKNKNGLLSQKLRNFHKRLHPNIWITGKVYGNSPIADIYSRDGGTNVGFTVENKSDSDLCDVQVALLPLKYSFSNHYIRGDCKFITDEDMGHITKFPIMLEWSPDEQGARGVLSATIPAGTSRLVGLFSLHSILSASHDIRSSLLVSMAFVYKVAVQISARGISAITTGDYIVTRIGSGREEEIPYKIEPESAVQISGTDTAV